MIQANELSVSFAGRKILEDISFNVHKGEKIGLVGRNGSGKTTLFKVITGDIEPDSGTLTVPKNYTVGYLEQHLLFTEETIVQEVCKGLKAGEEDDVWKGEKMLMGLGFTIEEMNKPPSFFSGGYQVRLNLAKVLLSEPHLLLLDEPTNYLDIVSIRWLINFLRSGENELILITHDRDFMDSITTHTMGIHRGRLKKTAGKTDRYFERINADEELYEKTRIKDEKKQKEAEEFINRFRAQASRASLVQSRVKMLDKMEKKTELETVETLGFSFKYSDFKAKELMKAENISFGYDPEKKLFSGFSINISSSDRICVVGKNGKGKSTLLRILARELEPDEGTIKRHDKIKTGYFGQTNIERLNKKNTIEEELSEVRPDLAYSEVRKVCGAMMFSGDLALKEISVLSGGEKSRVSLGKILLNPSNLLLLDEPTNHLDMESCDSMVQALDNFPGAVIMVTHSELFLKHMANRLIVFNGNKLSVFEGGYKDFIDSIGWDEEAAGEKKKDKKEKKILSGKEDRENRKKIKRESNRIRKRIEKTEILIDEGEKELESINKGIMDAAAEKDTAMLRELGKKSRELAGRIKENYSALEDLLVLREEYESISPEGDVK